jgi:secreted trypsin-like serine protease
MLNIGDSGGPFYAIKNNKHYVVGIASYGPIKCDEGLRCAKFVYSFKFHLILLFFLNYDFSINLSFYTRVSSYVDWIENARKSTAIQVKATSLCLLLTAVLIIF